MDEEGIIAFSNQKTNDDARRPQNNKISKGGKKKETGMDDQFTKGGNLFSCFFSAHFKPDGGFERSDQI